MADNYEEVVYSFEGDVGSLREATQQAIGLLDKYDSAIKKMASSDAFKASKTSATGFQRVVGGLVKQVNSLTASLNKAGDAVESAMPDGAAIMQDATKDIANVLSYLDMTTEATSDDLKYLTGMLKGTKEELEAVTARASMLSSTLKPLEQLQASQGLEQTKQAADAAGDGMQTVSNWAYRVQDAYKASGKSAVDSAMAFLKAEKAASKITNVQTALQRVQTEFNMFRAYATNIWRQVSEAINPAVLKLQQYRDKAASVFSRVTKIANTVAAAFRRISGAQDTANASADRATKAHRNLSNNLDKVNTQFTKETRAIKTEEDALKQKNQTLQNSSNRHRSLGSIITNLLNTFNRENRSILNLNTSLGNMGKRLGHAHRSWWKLLGLPVGLWLSKAANLSIQFAENLNLFSVAVGDAFDASYDFIKQMQELYGMDLSNLLRYTGYFYQLADAIDMPDEAASKLSLSLTKAANDIASLFNVDIETVVNDLASGMQGMSRAVRKYGMDIRSVTLQQTALSLGITDQVENMSEANRMGLRFITMMRQAANASGDFAKTIEQPANQLRIFKEQMSQLGRAIGNLFIKPLTKALQYINGFVMALRVAITYISSVLGIVEDVTANVDTESTDEIADSVSGIGDAASEASKEMKKLLGPFDELNVLTQASTSEDAADSLADVGALDPAILEAIEAMELKLEDVRMKANDVRDAILEFLGFKTENGNILSWDASVLEQNLIDKFPQWTNTIQAVFDNWTGIVEGFKNVFKSLGEVGQAVLDKIAKFFSGQDMDTAVADIISGLTDSLNKLADFISAHSDSIANFILLITGLFAAFKIGGSIVGVLKPVITTISRVVAAFAPFANVVAIIAAVTGAIALLYANSESFATSFKNLFSSLWTGFTEIFDSFIETLKIIGESLTRIWTDHMQPFVSALGDALAPVLDTIGALWQDLASIIASTFEVIAELWVSVVEPVLAAFFEALTGLANMFKDLWEGAVGPVVDNIGDSVKDLWKKHILPILSKVIEIIGAVIEIILALWNEVLEPLLSFIINTLGPGIAEVFNSIWDTISSTVGSIVDVIEGLIQVLHGLLDFIAGVFTGDWSRAWEGVVSAFKGIFETIGAVCRTVLNVVIGIVNTVVSAIVETINSIIRAANYARSSLSGSRGNSYTYSSGTIGSPSVPQLATGAVVTGPTMAMIGEGRYDEAIMPLGNSPQMNEFADNIASRVNSAEQIALLQEQNDLLRQILDKTGVHLDSRLISNEVSRQQRIHARATGGGV